jgi:polyphosphate kinase
VTDDPIVERIAAEPLPDPDDDPDLSDPAYYLNRELSELAFQRRVLQEALDERNPLLERVRFLGLFTKNIDEFVMKRVGGLKQQMDAGVTERTVDGRTPREQWEAVLDALGPMLDAQTDCFTGEVQPALAAAGIHVHAYEDLSAAQREDLRTYFEASVLPTLTPLAFDPAHPFPFISNRSLSLAVVTRRDDEDESTFTRVKIPQNRPRLVEVGDAEYVLLEEVVRENLDLLLPNVEIVDTSLFRLTRNAEVRRNEEVAEDLIEMIQEVLEQRRFATAVRLEVEADAPETVVDLLTEQLDLDEREVFRREGLLDYRPLLELTDLDRPELKLPDWTPLPHPRLERGSGGTAVPGSGQEERPSVFAEVARDDVLLHHPYHSFEETFQRFLEEAAEDPDVLAIKAAIYRTASDSRVIQSLIDAADNGKQVAVMVELKARFDEENNLDWVRTLEEEGIHVAYGTIGLKTHTKTALVVRDESDHREGDANTADPNGVRLYSHVGTGNYHSETAKGYVDLGLLTADRDIGRDLVKVFNFFTGPSLDEDFRKLLIAPVTMREEFTRYIRREAEHARAGRRARIVVKVNGLEDSDIVRELYEAARAGVEIDLVVRDICRLRPGIEGVSEDIRVHSVVGRFLEHSRIFYFENGGDPEWYTGSADWMTRNLDSRVEAVAPVEDPAIREQLRFNLHLLLSDNRKRWAMQSDGSYVQQRPDDAPEIDTQAVLMACTREANRRDDVHTGILPEHEHVDGDLLVEPVDDVSPDAPTVTGSAPDGDGDGDSEGDTEGNGSAGPVSEPDTLVANGGTSVASPDGSSGDLPTVLAANRDRWYVPDSDRYTFAVRTPDGDRRYFRTAAGAANAVERFYAGTA